MYNERFHANKILNESLQSGVLIQVKLRKKERSFIKVSSRSSARALIGDTVTEINN